MALVSTSIPNLINGVSQQPPSVRLVTQSEAQENGLSSVSEGLKKRPPTEHKDFFITGLSAQKETDMANAFFHPIRNSDNSLHFLMIEKDGTMTITDSTGTVKSITNNGSGYLSGLTNPRQQLTATTVADYTFLVNKTKVVAKTSTKSTARTPEALLYVAKADYSVTYTVKITKGGTVYTREITTMASTQDTTPNAALAEKSIQTDRIATNLRFDQTVDATYYGSGTGSPISISGISFVQYGNVIHIIGATASDQFDIEVTDSRGGEHLRAFKGETPDFKKLPTDAPIGFVILVSGDNQKGQDDYYVRYQKNVTNGLGVWKETVEPNIDIELDAATMPHTLIYDGTSYTFDEADYADREVGNDLTNPFPSFLDNTINDVFFHRNRLGLLADENVIFSEAGEYFNFFSKTVLTLVDSAPIDVAVSNNQVSILRHAVPFNETLLLFSDYSQFKLSAVQVLTPETVSIDVTTRFETSLEAKPVGAGKYVYFPTSKGSFSGIREYFVDAETETNDANEITAHVPEYLQGTAIGMAAASNEDMLLVLTDEDRTVIYPYKFFWSGREKLQSAWSKWKFSGEVLGVEFDKADIFLVIQYGSKVALERINLSLDDALNDAAFPILLDRRVRLTGADTIPYTDPNLQYVTDAGSIVTAAAALTYQGTGGVVYAGVPYTFLYEFSEQLMKSNNNSITTGRLQIKSMAVVYSDTGFFEITVVPHKTLPVAVRKSYTRAFTGRVVGAGTNIIGAVPLDSGSYSFGVQANAKNAQIKITSDSFLPCEFQSAELESEFVLRSRRM
jgi:hypothetical protein